MQKDRIYQWSRDCPGPGWELRGTVRGFDYVGNLWRQRPMLIGLSGHIRAGKDSVADYLCSHHHFVKIGFADSLKREVLRTLPRTLQEYVRTQYGFTEREQIDGKIADLLYVNRDPVTRALLQEWGTDLRRQEDPQYWVRKWQTAYLDSPAQDVVVPDVRFPNEGRCVVGMGGDLLLVRRPGQEGNGHKSESFCDTFAQWNAVLENDGTLQELYDKVEAWLHERRLQVQPKGAGLRHSGR